jgi:predicted RNA methylase
MPKQVAITPEVRAVLERSTVDGNVVRLPEGQLARPLYEAVDKVLKALGGKWNRGKGGHVFERGIEGQLADALASGRAVDQTRTQEQFFTPPAVAAVVWGRADLRDDSHVLEPSAGRGALLAAPLALGCLVTAVERDPLLVPALRGLLGSAHGCGVWEADFTTWTPTARAPIDRVVMNPPFSRCQDIAHVTRAFDLLAPGGRLVAVMSPHRVRSQDRPSNDFRVMLSRLGDDAYDWEDLPASSFRSSGTDVSTGIITIDKDDA